MTRARSCEGVQLCFCCMEIHNVWLYYWHRVNIFSEFFAGGAVSKSKLTCVTGSVTLTVMYSAATKRTQPAPCGNDRGGDITLCFICYTNCPVAVPFFLAIEICQAVRLLLDFPFHTFLSFFNLHFVYTRADKGGQRENVDLLLCGAMSAHRERQTENPLAWCNWLKEINTLANSYPTEQAKEQV